MAESIRMDLERFKERLTIMHSCASYKNVMAESIRMIIERFKEQASNF